MKKSVFTLIAVLVLSTSTSFAQRYGGSRQNGGNTMQNVMSSRSGNRSNMNAARHDSRTGGVVRYVESRPVPVVHHVAPAPVPVVRYHHHHPVPPVHVVHRPAPVYVEPVYVAPAPPPVVIHNSTAAGIVAGAVTVTALAALLCH